MESKEIENKENLEGSESVVRSEEEYFSSWGRVEIFLNEIISINWKECWKRDWEEISSSLLIFQEQPTLLSPYLEKIIIPLTNTLIEILLQHQNNSNTQFQVSRILH